VGDVVGAVIRLAGKEDVVGQVFNIGGNEEITIADLAQRVKAIAGSDSEIVYVPYAEAYEEGFEDMPRRVPDISRIQQAIGYSPSLGIDQIIQRVVEYYRTR